ncbi:DUF413 domain-containing protein [Gilvimarinus algae]|uniref:Macrodomain Ori protein n=1 Tax=Gilvimarinus algae TaxID=3058037 RepID=A0ABT8TEV0_9GAMM|nr:DUF413 domain-containing protein [Gilvimarinus sp. SDUM040014]MDO3381908.1 DUF413 domain-containing protein [Gilvimarinus sp. SDUM040014]
MLPREHYLKQPFHGLQQLTDTSSLTSAQTRLIKKHGALITALLSDEVLNPNLADLRLVKTLSNKSAPTNPVEQAWLKYEALLQAQQPKAKPLKKSA